MAITQRLAFAVEPAPPYYALLGAHAAKLVGVARAHGAAGTFPTHTPLPVVVRIRRLDRRPTPIGWIDAASPTGWKTYEQELFGPITLASDPPATEDRCDRGQQWRGAASVFGLSAWLADALRFAARPGHLADPALDSRPLGVPVTETSLAAACVTLATWEQAYRIEGSLPDRVVGDGADPPDVAAAVRSVLGSADPAVVADGEAMARLAADSGALGALRALAGTASSRVPLGRDGPVPFGYARPVLVPHWADAAAVIGDAGTPGGTTLLHVVATGTPTPDRVAAWCRQLLAQCWLDGHDLYRIGRAAIYFARHGQLLTWTTAHLAAHLAGVDPGDTAALDLLREEFRTLAIRAASGDGADPRWLQPAPPGENATTATRELHQQTLGP
ncbi:hypothetical protein [Actinomycetospora soli]|uniref:hypothetical protein n=1 Tax=Actinomycetospora soli TaxID=2893887 RepID=UPI001E3964EA|nr:hypothetical protein [Actinomycetospora soli]MCD2191628.1 hypothetical protein [Actinomycetospora soli]